MSHIVSFPPFTRRRLLKSTAAAAAVSLWAGPGASLRAAATNRQPGASNQPLPSGPITAVPLSVSATASGEMPGAFVGLAYSKDLMLGTLFSRQDTSMINVFRQLGWSSLRIGGASADSLVWSPNGPGAQPGYVAPTDVDNLAEFLKATQWSCIYGINLAGSATGATNPSLAAAEVAYVAGRLGSSLAAIEIGNEPDLYGRVGNAYANNWTFDGYFALWNEYREAIEAVTPGVPIAGPADAGNPLTWTVPFIENVTKPEVKLITQHYYVASAVAPDATLTELLTVSLHHDLVENLAAINDACEQSGIPFRMGECGDFYNNSGTTPPVNVAGSYAAALWGIDYMFMCAQGGAAGVNFESGGPIPNYTPILDNAAAVTAIAPLFYGMLLMTLAGTGTVLETTVSPGALNVTAYALQTSGYGSGRGSGYSVIVLNKEQSANIQLQIELPSGVRNASLLEMTQLSPGADAPNVLATSGVTIQGAEVNPDGSFSPSRAYELTPEEAQLTCYVPALSAVLIQAF